MRLRTCGAWWVPLALAALLPGQAHYPMRGVLVSPGGELPFVMSAVLGPHRVYHGADFVPVKWRGKDRGVVLDFPPYDSRIEAECTVPEVGPDGGLRGTWQKTGPAGTVTMPFRWEAWPIERDPKDPTRGLHGPLFPLDGEPLDVSGRWLVKFGKDAPPAVAVLQPNRGPFVQVPGEIEGTFLTVTGDYRYLAGTARGKELRLACFDGAHAFLFAAQLQQDGSLRGDFWSGTSWHETWSAKREEGAALPDAFTLTQARADADLAGLRFPDATAPEQQPRRIGDLLGKATLVVLFGTWCPNCGDAGAFLKELQARYAARGLAVVGLAFEHGTDAARHQRVLADYKQHHNVSWPILLAGPSDKAAASAAFPVLDAVRAFPTTLFVDAEGKVRSVHQGFAGPATGKAHAEQREAFEQIVIRLLDETRGSGGR